MPGINSWFLVQLIPWIKIINEKKYETEIWRWVSDT